MSEEKPATGSNGNGGSVDGRTFLLQQLYLKDLSYESPNVPEVFTKPAAEPDTQLNIKNSHRLVGDDVYEVVLHLSVHSKQGDSTVFLVEIDQAGVFLLKGYSEEERKQLLSIFCPNTLFPYAREAISSLVGKGGFPPLVLQPINFEALYARAVQEQGGTQGQA